MLTDIVLLPFGVEHAEGTAPYLSCGALCSPPSHLKARKSVASQPTAQPTAQTNGTGEAGYKTSASVPRQRRQHCPTVHQYCRTVQRQNPCSAKKMSRELSVPLSVWSPLDVHVWQLSHRLVLLLLSHTLQHACQEHMHAASGCVTCCASETPARCRHHVVAPTAVGGTTGMEGTPGCVGRRARIMRALWHSTRLHMAHTEGEQSAATRAATQI